MMLGKLDIHMPKKKREGEEIGPLFHAIYNSQLKMD